jgi:hypothetical protein
LAIGSAKVSKLLDFATKKVEKFLAGLLWLSSRFRLKRAAKVSRTFRQFLTKRAIYFALNWRGTELVEEKLSAKLLAFKPFLRLAQSPIAIGSAKVRGFFESPNFCESFCGLVTRWKESRLPPLPFWECKGTPFFGACNT